MAGITEATLPRKRAVYIYVKEDGVVANCISSALTERDFRKKCEICKEKWRLQASAARSWSGGTGTARGRCQMPRRLVVVGAGNSLDPGPARLWHEAKRGTQRSGGGCAIGGEIVHQPPSHVFFNTAWPEGHQVSGMWTELEERGSTAKRQQEELHR